MGSYERRCRLLVRLYPRSDREARGAELLTTLLDLAEAGGCRLSPRDCWDVLVGALAAHRRAHLPVRRILAMAALGACSGTAGVGAWHGPALLAPISAIGLAVTLTLIMASNISRRDRRGGFGHGAGAGRSEPPHENPPGDSDG